MLATSGTSSRIRRSASRRDRFASMWLATSSIRSEEHTSELQSPMRNSYDVFCLKTKNKPSTKSPSRQYLHTIIRETTRHHIKKPYKQQTLQHELYKVSHK